MDTYVLGTIVEEDEQVREVGNELIEGLKQHR